MKTKNKNFTIDQVKSWEIHGEPELTESVAQLGVIEPIIMGESNGVLKLLAGQRRCASLIKAYDMAVEAGGTIPDHLKSIKAVIYEGLTESDENAISIAENEQRSANPVNTWKQIQAAFNRGDFDKVIALSKLNKNRLKALQKLNQVRPALIEAYDENKISESTLMASASLGGARQDYLLTLLSTKKRITMSDVAEAKKARTAAVLATRPMLNNTPIAMPTITTQFILLDNSNGGPKIFTSLQDALAAKNELDASFKLYRLIEL